MARMNDYDDSDAIVACKSVMLEVLTILGKHRDHLVIIGGWVPPLLFGPGDHIGSIDVDLAVDSRNLPDYIYETIKNELAAHAYDHAPGDPPNRFRRTLKMSTRERIVKVDVITGIHPGESTGSSHAILQGLPIWRATGVSVALDHFRTVTLNGPLPESGGINTLRARVASAGALVIMKAMAMDERYKAKDAYDIYYCCQHHPQGIPGLADEIFQMLAHPEVQRGVTLIKTKFATLDSVGPTWAAKVIEANGGDFQQARQDAFQRIALLLELLATK
jgi:hypothetical protein